VLASYPGSRGRGKGSAGEPGINCMRMRIISPVSGETCILIVLHVCSYTLTSPDARSCTYHTHDEENADNANNRSQVYKATILSMELEDNIPDIVFFPSYRICVKESGLSTFETNLNSNQLFESC
jgi:hypothetical protein